MKLSFIFLPVVVLFVGLVVHPFYYYNVSVRQTLLHDETNIFSNGVYVMSVFGNEVPAGSGDPPVQELVHSVQKGNGKIVYLGKVISQLASKQFHLPHPEVVVVTTWPHPSDFVSWKSSVEDDWDHHRVQVFDRSALTNSVVPSVLSLLYYKSFFTGFFDLEKEGDWRANPKLEDLISKFDGPDRPVMVWNWLKEGTEEQQKANSEYGWKMVQMHSQTGCGLLNIGYPVSPNSVGPSTNPEKWDEVEVDGQFYHVAGVYYPGTRFFVKMLKSAWMVQTSKGKQLGDTLAVITTPIYLD